MIAGRSATVETVARIRAELGLDRPLAVQYARYLQRLAHGDLGRSYAQKVEVAELLRSRLAATFFLMVGGIFFELLIGLPAGLLAAVRRRSRFDRAVMLGAFVGVSAPQFVLGLLLLYLLAYTVPVFPLGGYGTPAHLILPAVTLGIAGGGWYARMMRSAMLEVIHQDYVRTARAKGADEARVLTRHALRNALLPVVTLIGLDFGTFMGGVVVVESVFGWPGIGQLAWQAIQIVDIPVIMGVVLVSAVAILLGNLMADLAYPLLDPRIRYG
jgi:peptide/nickel transport system permease protein